MTETSNLLLGDVAVVPAPDLQIGTIRQHFQRQLLRYTEFPQPRTKRSLHPVALQREACFERLRFVDKYPGHAG